MRRALAVAARVPPWAVALVAFPAGLGLAVFWGVLARDVAAYVCMAAVAEVLVMFKRWAARADGEEVRRVETTGVYQVIETSGAILPARRDDQ